MKKEGCSELLNFFKGKSVFITGNTGFKGSWLTYILLNAGAKVTGFSLQPPTEPSLFKLAGLDKRKDLSQYYNDVRNLTALQTAFDTAQPDIVFHLAAQPLVRESYKDPVGTYFTNVMGTVNVCECVRNTLSVKSFVNITTDKVYKNNDWEWGYRESDYLDGHDPYSNSKSCSELVTHSYKDSFFTDGRVSVSTARAGNVIGGGDFSIDRIIPDCVKAVTSMDGIINIRNPYSIRPFEHVLEPLFAYLIIAKEQFQDGKYAGYYNVGPDDVDCISTGDLVTLFCKKWNDNNPEVVASWTTKKEEDAPSEAKFLKLDCSKFKMTFGWKPRWHIEKAVEETVRFTKTWCSGGNIGAEMIREIDEYVT